MADALDEGLQGERQEGENLAGEGGALKVIYGPGS